MSISKRVLKLILPKQILLGNVAIDYTALEDAIGERTLRTIDSLIRLNRRELIAILEEI